MGEPRAAIFGTSGPRLTADERRFLAEADPWGLILFTRNVETKAQTAALIAEFREAVGRAKAPVFVDQEGGGVQRLGPPDWPARPPLSDLVAAYEADAEAGLAAAHGRGRALAEDLAAVGANVNCVPLLDVTEPGTHDIIASRAFGSDIATVIALSRAVMEGTRAGGCLPVVKHIPGHGRARADSHNVLPVVDAPREALARDFAPFRALREAEIAMTAHVVYSALDPTAPATLSPSVIGGVIRGEIGFEGLLLSDDLCMSALSGPPARRAEGAIWAGCDVALHCNGALGEMVEIAAAIPRLSGPALARARAVEAAL